MTVVQDEPMNFGDFVGAAAFVTSIVLPVLGIMVVTSEWSQRTAMVTFALEPRRPLIIAAKALTGVILTLVTAALSIAIGLICNLLYIALQGDGSWEFGTKYLFGFLITQTLAMLGGFALATLFLNTPAAIVVFFVYKWVLPGLFALGSALIGWFERPEPVDRLPGRPDTPHRPEHLGRRVGSPAHVRSDLARDPAGVRAAQDPAGRGQVAPKCLQLRVRFPRG